MKGHKRNRQHLSRSNAKVSLNERLQSRYAPQLTSTDVSHITVTRQNTLAIYLFYISYISANSSLVIIEPRDVHSK